MKKLLLLFVPFLFLLGCTKTTYKEISMKELNTMIDTKESFALFIGATSCSHCDTYKGTLKKVIKDYDVEVYYIDIDNLSADENSTLKSIASYTGTPTTVFIENGKEKSAYSRIIGDRDYDYIVNKFKASEYIEKVK
ncbi:MAG: thioredoxin domain-containing protein [Bacilli bacterium]|nr:thioredoxin domain-containing protein [Bacilli bacterium]